MAKVAFFLIDGFEETEAVTPIDILRRGGVQVQIVSLNGRRKEAMSKHGVQIMAEATLEDWDKEVDMLALPGGTVAYLERPDFLALIEESAHAGRKLAAICAAPAVFGKLGLLKGKKAVIYPGMESHIEGSDILDAPVVTDGQFTTSMGPGTSVPFGLELLALLEGKEAAERVKTDFLV